MAEQPSGSFGNEKLHRSAVRTSGRRSNRARMCNPPDWQHGVARNAFWHFGDPDWSTSVEFRARATVIRDTFWVRNPSGKEAGSPLLFPTHRRVPGHVGFFKGIFLEAAHWAARRVRSRPDPLKRPLTEAFQPRERGKEPRRCRARDASGTSPRRPPGSEVKRRNPWGDVFAAPREAATRARAATFL